MADDIKADIAISSEAKIARLFIMSMVILILMFLPVIPHTTIVEQNFTQKDIESQVVGASYENQTTFNSWFTNTNNLMKNSSPDLLSMSVITFVIYAAIGFIASRLIRV